jgi:steroid 5-alpha reductase family enzyme
MDPLLLVLIVAGVTCAFCWIASLITKDTSWVDRIWSIVPAVYVWIFAIAGVVRSSGADAVSAGTQPGDMPVGTSGGDAVRLVVMAVLVTLWAARLTFNFARKGGYTGMEDYRWAVLRGRMKPWQFQVFNLLFIVLYQNALLVLITLPAYIAWQHPTPFGVWDAVFAVVFLAFLVGEFTADQQQWRFHQAKKAGTAQGFLTTGLFAYSRHPNFFFEQAQWWAFYAIGAVAAVGSGLGFWGGAINWTIIGAALLTVLFIGSTIFTESISASKYPAYREYQRTTSMLVPLPRRRRTEEHPRAV